MSGQNKLTGNHPQEIHNTGLFKYLKNNKKLNGHMVISLKTAEGF